MESEDEYMSGLSSEEDDNLQDESDNEGGSGDGAYILHRGRVSHFLY